MFCVSRDDSVKTPANSNFVVFSLILWHFLIIYFRLHGREWLSLPEHKFLIVSAFFPLFLIFILSFTCYFVNYIFFYCLFLQIPVFHCSYLKAPSAPFVQRKQFLTKQGQQPQTFIADCVSNKPSVGPPSRQACNWPEMKITRLSVQQTISACAQEVQRSCWHQIPLLGPRRVEGPVDR